MSKILPLLLLLPLSLGAFAQHVTCNSTTHLNSQVPPHYCTNFTTPSGEYLLPSAGATYSPLYEDGSTTVDPDFPGGVGLVPDPYPFSRGQVSLPSDPLKLMGLVWNNLGTYFHSILNGPWKVTVLNGPSNGCGGGYAWQIVSYQFVSLQATDYTAYTWSGTYTQNFTGQKKIGRYGHCVTNYVTTTNSPGVLWTDQPAQ